MAGEALEYGPDAIILLDGALRVSWLNTRARGAFVQCRARPERAELLDLFPTMRGTAIESALRAALADRRVHTVERLIGPNGCWYELHLLPAGGGVAAHFRDVSDVVAAETTLRTNEAHYRQVVENTCDVVIVLGADGRIQYASPATARTLGQSPATLVGRHWTAYAHPDDVTELESAFARALSSEAESPTAVQARVRGASGSWRVVEAAGQRVPTGGTDGGTPEEASNVENAPIETEDAVRWRGVVDLRDDAPRGRRRPAPATEPVAVFTIRDVTDRVAAEEALRASESHYRALLEQLGDGIAAIDTARGGRFVAVNARLCEMTGYTRDELLGMPAQELVTDVDGDDVEERLAQLVQGGALLTRQRIRRKDGSVLVAELNSRLIGTRVQVVVRDVTDREEFEERRRTTQKLEALGLLAGSVAHDFNNFLLAIQSNVELALAEADSGGAGSTVRGELSEIARVAQRAAGVTRQLLTFSRRHAGEPAVFPLGDAVTGIEQMLRRLVRPRVALALRGTADSARVRADQGQVEQAVMNLVMNARDAMPDGGVVTIEVVSRALPAAVATGLTGAVVPPGAYVVLSVADTGTGMSPDVARRAFEPLFTTKSEGAGTGLGLWTVQAVVAQAGGHVSVESAPGAGSRFEMWFRDVDQDARARPGEGGGSPGVGEAA